MDPRLWIMCIHGLGYAWADHPASRASNFIPDNPLIIYQLLMLCYRYIYYLVKWTLFFIFFILWLCYISLAELSLIVSFYVLTFQLSVKMVRLRQTARKGSGDLFVRARASYSFQADQVVVLGNVFWNLLVVRFWTQMNCNSVVSICFKRGSAGVSWDCSWILIC